MNSFSRYRLIDLVILALVMCLLEGLISLAVGLFPGEAYALSVVLPVTLIVIMRWGWFGLIHAAIGGAVYSVILGGELMHLIIYAAGNLGVAACVPFLLVMSKERVRKSAFLSIAYVAIGWLGMGIFRSLIALAHGAGGFAELAGHFYSAEALNLLACIIIVLIARKQNGVFEDQRLYLIRIEQEK